MEKKQVFAMLGIVLVVTIAIIGYCLFYGNKYVVEFDSKGGTEVEDQTVRVGKKVEEPEAPTREGYKFIEWQLDGKKYDFDSKVKGNMTLEAKWQKMTDAASIFYTVTFDSKGGSEVDEQYIAVGETVEKPTNPVREGYTFNGWYYNDKKYDFDKKVSQDMTLTAKWKKKGSSGSSDKNSDKDTDKNKDKDTDKNTDKDTDKNNDKNKDDDSSLSKDLKVGDRVRIVGSYASSSTSGKNEAIHTRAIGWKRVILKIYEGREYPYRVGNSTGTTGFFKAESLEKIG